MFRKDGGGALLVYEDRLKTEMEFDGSGNPIYIGRALPGSATSAPVWQIQKLTWDGAGNPIEVHAYANGSFAYNMTWDSRASLSYS